MLTAIALLAAAPAAADLRRLLPADPRAPGCALDVRRDGALVAALATGTANLEDGTAIGPDTVFEIGSVSKQFIGAGLAILATRGALSLDDPIVKWLPELPPLYAPVTIAMLAHHTSGIRNWNNLAELTGRGEDSTGYDNAWVLRAVARQRRLNSAPGAEYLYSNSNFVLGAIIIERASGQPLNRFFREAVFDRLGMERTRWRTDFREIVPARAQAYAPDGRGGWRLDMPFNDVAGAGGLLSTLGDLQRWNAALAGPAPGDRAWTALLQQRGRLADGTGIGYAMGLETDPIAGAEAISHAGSTGSYRAWLGRVPGERLSMALLCNSGAVNTEELGPAVAALFLPHPPGRAEAATERPASVPPGLVGRWRNVANDADVVATADAAGLHLNGGAAFAPDAAGRLASADGRRVITVRRHPGGGIAELSVARIGNAPTRLAPVTSWRPSPAELRRLIGAYATPEIDGVQRIELVAGALVWRDPSGAPHPLVATYRGAFDAPDASWTLRFRESGGRTAVDFSITRARRITMTRVTRGARPAP